MKLECKKEVGKSAVVIGGPAFAGKSTVGDLFILNSNLPFKRSPMAADIKILIHKYFGLTDDEAKKLKPELREHYQRLGTEAVRKHYTDDFWVTLALRNPDYYLVFDDVRYFSEINTVKYHCDNVYYIWVDASIECRKQRCEKLYGAGSWEKQDFTHSSENEFNGKESFWNYTIQNSGDVEDLLIVNSLISLFEQQIKWSKESVLRSRLSTPPTGD